MPFVPANIGWNHLTDLGVNFIGSYSFYLLGSPFFWLTIPFPGEWLQYLMGPLFILKFGCASLSGYIYLHRYAKNPNTALLASLLYAFSATPSTTSFSIIFTKPSSCSLCS